MSAGCTDSTYQAPPALLSIARRLRDHGLVLEAQVIRGIVVSQSTDNAEDAKLQRDALDNLSLILQETEQEIEGSLSELENRPHADELLSRLLSELTLLPPQTRWHSLEFLFRSAANLRKLNDDSRASRLMSDVGTLFDKNEEFRKGVDLSALMSIAERLRRDEHLSEARLILEKTVELAEGDNRLRLDASKSLEAVLREIRELQKKADQAIVRKALEDPAIAPGTSGIETTPVVRVLQSSPGTRMALEEMLGTLKMARLSADQNPTDLRCQRDLSAALQRVGTEQLRRGELQDALGTLTESLGIERTLAASDANNFTGQRRLLLALQSVGDVRARQDKYAEALIDYNEAWAVGTRLEGTIFEKSGDDLGQLLNDLRERIDTTRLETVAAGRV
jgi:tetratricopeptide (TPR) repeat protein